MDGSITYLPANRSTIRYADNYVYIKTKNRRKFEKSVSYFVILCCADRPFFVQKNVFQKI